MQQRFSFTEEAGWEGSRGSSRNVKNLVYLRLIDEDQYPHEGHMDFVDNRVDRGTGTMRGRAIFPNDDDLLTPGMFAEVRIPLSTIGFHCDSLEDSIGVASAAGAVLRRRADTDVGSEADFEPWAGVSLRLVERAG